MKDEDEHGNSSRNLIRKSSPTKTNLDKISKINDRKQNSLKPSSSVTVGYSSRL